MATIVTYTGSKIQEIANKTVVEGNVDANKHLILEQRDGTQIDGGLIESPKGPVGLERALSAGQIELYAGSFPPVGWTWCDGSEQLRSEYPELFAAIGTKYGAGDGTTTFNLPNFGGRVGVGKDATQTEFNDLGATGGEKTHKLTTTELPSHKHTMLGYKGVDDKNFTGNLGRFQASDAGTTAFDKQTQPKGGDQPHNNLQPYITLTHIISTGKVSGSHGGGTSWPRVYTQSRRGTTAQRDAIYGVPTTSAARVALANQQVTWFNTDLGWKESYYEVGTASGLTVRGLFTDAPAGWYPIGEGGPYIELEAPAEVSNFFNTFITGWSILNRKGKSSWFTLSGTDRVNVLKPGRYDLKVYTTQYAALNGVAPDYALQVLDVDNATVVANVGGGAFIQNVNYNTRPHAELYDRYILGNQKVAYKLQRGTKPAGDTTMQVHGGGPDVIRGRLRIQYIAPPINDMS